LPKIRTIDPNRIIGRFEVKAVNTEERTFEGYCAVFENVDRGGDIIEKGAFTRTIGMNVKAGKVKLLDHHNRWSVKDLVGKLLEAKEDDFGLWIKAYVSETPLGDQVLTQIKEGVLDALSFGYNAIKFEYQEVGDKIARRLKEVALFEVSPVIFGMNELAYIDANSVKSIEGIDELKVAPADYEWDADKALENIKALEDVNGFTIKLNDSLELLYADIIDGKPHIVGKALDIIACHVESNDVDKDRYLELKSVLDVLFAKTGKIPPWQGLVFLEEAIKSIGTIEEVKAGKVLSAANMKLVSECIDVLTALREAAQPSEKALAKANGLANPEKVAELNNRLRNLQLEQLVTSA